MQRQHTRILILALFILIIICIILMRADHEMEVLDQQMRVIGCTIFTMII